MSSTSKKPASLADRFNATRFARWINGGQGRVFRLVAGTAWLIFGLTFIDHWWGVAGLAWSFFPLTAGIFDICWISAAIGGPLSGRSIKARQPA